MIGTKVSATGAGVEEPSISLERTTLNAGSRVLTVWVSEMATAAKDRLDAMCPIACMEAGPRIFINSSLVIGRWKDAALKPSR